MASSAEDKRLRAELTKELGFSPATLDPEDIEEHRRHNAAADRAPSAERVGKMYAHLIERRRRAEVEARGRVEIADLYEDL
jgi:hypothetical protein